MERGGSQVRAQAFMPGWMRWERQGVEWHGITKPTVMMSGVASARRLEEGG